MGLNEKLNKVRLVIIRLAQNPILRWLFSRLYDAQLGLLALLLYTRPYIKVFLLRDGGKGLNWSPGISDFDVTLITEHLDDADRIRCSLIFWQAYTRLRRWIPMFIEVDLLSLNEFIAMNGPVSAPLQSLKTFKVVFSKLSSHKRQKMDDAIQAARQSGDDHAHLLNAFTRYEHFVFSYYLEIKECSHAVCEILTEHSIRKTNAILDQFASRYESDSPFLRLYRTLDHYCQTHLPAEGVNLADTIGLSDDASFLEELRNQINKTLTRNIRLYTSVVLWRAHGARRKASLVMILHDHLSDDLVETLHDDLKQFYEENREIFTTRLVSDPMLFYPAQSALPLFLSRAMWLQWLDFYPFEAKAFATQHIVVCGTIEGLLFTPSTQAYRRNMVIQYGMFCIMRNNWLACLDQCQALFTEMNHRLASMLGVQDKRLEEIEELYRRSTELLTSLEHLCAPLFEIEHSSGGSVSGNGSS